MCYSFESSMRTSFMSLIAIIILINSSAPKYIWLGFTLIGWCAMQFAEGLLWLTDPKKGCSETNKFITKYLIPLTLILQPLTSLYGYGYITKYKNLTKNETRFFVFYTIFILCLVIGWFNIPLDKTDCTTITKKGHLYWAGTYPPSKTLTNIHPIATLIWGLLISLPIIIFWRNPILSITLKDLLLIFPIPLYGMIKGLQSESIASVWCYVTSYSSMWFVFLLFLHKNGIKLL